MAGGNLGRLRAAINRKTLGGVTVAAHSLYTPDLLAFAGVTGSWCNRLPHTLTTCLRKCTLDPQPPAHSRHMQARPRMLALGNKQHAPRLLLPRP
jgi:hypothetical protein